jgi:DNA modification methylase
MPLLACLGEPFPDESARRAHFLAELRRYLADPAFRSRVDFPLGADSHVVALSDPPYFTACPNPFVADFLRVHGRPADPSRSGSRPAFTGDLRSATRHPVSGFHPYHTKVPPEALRRLIEHYTDPGEVVLDGFCGSGMTGVAAREAGRHAVLADLSPVAAFVAAVNCRSHDRAAAGAGLREILAASESVWDRLYRTRESGRELPVHYFVRSDVFGCPGCGVRFPFFPHGVEHTGRKVRTRAAFPCPGCGKDLTVRRVRRVVEGGVKQAVLAWVNAGPVAGRVNRPPNDTDRELAARVEREPVAWHPTDPVRPDGYSARLAQLGAKAITDVSRFLSPRNLRIFADLWARVGAIPDAGVRNLCRATLTGVFTVISERQGYFGGGGGMSGNFYVPIVRMEKNPYETLRRKLVKLDAAERAKEGLTGEAIVSTQSCTALSGVPDASVDYVCTDPPFGANIIYSELNLVLEAWLGVRTNPAAEAVIDVTRGREADGYAALLRSAFAECYRVLKPGRWLTVEFHNTSPEVWNRLQAVLGETGFVVASAGVLDKGSTTILGDIRDGSAKHDLLISAYKPDGVGGGFRLTAGSPEAAWAFVAEHLRRLPEASEERRRHRLFDRMVAFHVQRRLAVPLSAVEFYAGLRRRFAERGEAYFLPGPAR